MIVDSSALAEQVVADVVASAFDSAGQRCSALRVLCVQRDGAERLIEMLRGRGRRTARRRPAPAGGRRRPGHRRRGAGHDRAPHRRDARAAGAASRAAPRPTPAARGRGTLRAADADRDRRASPSSQREVFGPVLHVLRYERERPGRPAGADQRHRLRPDDGRAHPHRRDAGAGRARGPRRQRLRQPQHRRRRRRRPALRRRGPVGHRPEGRRSAVPAATARPRAPPTRRCAPAAKRWRRRSQPPVRGWVADGDDEAASSAQRALRDWARCPERRRAGAGDRPTSPRRRRPSAAGAPSPGRPAKPNLYAMLPREAVLVSDRGRSADERRADGAEADRLRQLAAVLAVGSRAVWPAAVHGRCASACRGGARTHLAGAGLARRRRALRRGPAPRLRRASLRRCCRHWPQRTGADRRRHGARAGQRRRAAGAPADRALAQHQHRRRGRQREPDDDRLRCARANDQAGGARAVTAHWSLVAGHRRARTAGRTSRFVHQQRRRQVFQRRAHRLEHRAFLGADPTRGLAARQGGERARDIGSVDHAARQRADQVAALGQRLLGVDVEPRRRRSSRRRLRASPA